MPRLATATRDSYNYRDQLDRPNQFYIDGVRAVPSDGAGLNTDYLLFGSNNPGMEISAVRDTPYQVEIWFNPDPVCFSSAEHRHLVYSFGAISSTAQANHRAVVLVVGQNSGGLAIAQVGRRDGTGGANWSSSNFNVPITPGGWHYFKAVYNVSGGYTAWLYDYTAATWRLNSSNTTYVTGTHEGINIGNVVGTWGNEMLFSNGDSKPFVGGISCFRVALTSDDGVNPNTSGIPTYTPANVGTNALIGFIGPS
jgi:hypothetical protein